MGDFIKWIGDLFRGVRFWAVVLPWERAVRVRFGRFMRLWDPGFHFKIPILDEVRTFNNRLRIASFPSLTVTTKDGKTVTAAGLVGFRIADPIKVMLALSSPETTLAGLAMAHAAKYVSEHEFSTLAVPELEASATDALTIQAPGCVVDFVRLVDFAAVRTFRLLQDQWRPGTPQSCALD